MKRWKIRQGSSRAIVSAEDYEAARLRASQIGFDHPDTCALVESPEAEEAFMHPPKLTPIRRDWSKAERIGE